MSTIKEKYLNDLLKNNEGIKILNKKFSTIITDKDFYKYGLLTKIIQALIKNGYAQTIFDNFNLILSSSLPDETFDILLLIKSIPNSNQLFSNNIEEIYLKLEGEEILEFIELLDKSKQDEIFKRNEFSYNLYKEGFIRESTLGNIIKGDLSIFIEELIKEVSEGKKLESLEAGTYNDAILTNDYVIKLGETRDKFEIPYHPNILQPLLRERIKDKNGKDILIVEVQNKVDTKNITDSQRKELIKKLSKAQITCRDILYGNIGILLKPNQRALFNGVGGIQDYDDIKEETLQPGEPVIFDTDMIEKNDENNEPEK